MLLAAGGAQNAAAFQLAEVSTLGSWSRSYAGEAAIADRRRTKTT